MNRFVVEQALHHLYLSIIPKMQEESKIYGDIETEVCLLVSSIRSIKIHDYFQMADDNLDFLFFSPILYDVHFIYKTYNGELNIVRYSYM